VRVWTLIVMLGGLSLATVANAEAITAEPDSLTFTSTTQTQGVKLYREGHPVAADDILGLRLLASGNDYRYMFRYEKRDGVLSLTPSDQIEVGSYDLMINTRSGTAYVKVYTPLSELPDIVQQTAQSQGISEQEARERLGLTSRRSSSAIRIELPPVYYEGQILELYVPSTPDTEYIWYINGQIIAQGNDQNTLNYTFPAPGEYVLAYREVRDGSVVTEAVARTRVVAIPAVQYETAPGLSVVFRGPERFSQYEWLVGGQHAGSDECLNYTFKEAGTQTVECIATGPLDGPANTAFLHIYYRVLVR